MNKAKPEGVGIRRARRRTNGESIALGGVNVLRMKGSVSNGLGLSLE
jgi:hypothetical protein